MTTAPQALSDFSARYHAALPAVRRQVYAMQLGDLSAALKSNRVPHMVDLVHVLTLRQVRNNSAK